MEKMDAPQKKTPRKINNKVRVKLPTIESYEKTLEFPAEGPGRVVVRLERLMGSDRIRITDPKYLSTLVERLEAEEDKSWGSRSRLRKKAEKNRSRQLAIEGLMEPADDMQDLYEHPVFRVNRVLNRLAMFDTNMSVGNAQKMPPIVEVDLFTPEDDSGRIFKTYPQHLVFHKQTLPYAETRYSRRSTVGRQSMPHVSLASRQSTSPGSVQSRRSVRKIGSVSPAKYRMTRKRGIRPRKIDNSTRSLYRASKMRSASLKPSGMDINKQSKLQMSAEEADDTGKSKEDTMPSTDKSKKMKGTTSSKSSRQESEVGSGDDEGRDKEKKDKDAKRGRNSALEENSESLQDFMLAYGVPSDQNLVRDWQAFKSHLVERVYEENGGSSDELYELAGHVIGTYDRQLDLVDEFVDTRGTSVQEERKKMGLPSDPKLVAKMLLQQRDKRDEADDDGDGDAEDDGEEEGEEDGDADKHYKEWSKNGSKSTKLEDGSMKDNLRGSKSKSTIVGSKSQAVLSTTKSKSNLSKSKSRTVVDGEWEEDEEEEEEESGKEEGGFGEISVTESLAGEDEEEAQENEDEEEEAYENE